MTHDDARDLLPLQALGVLEGDERSALEAHLAGCPACREVLADEERAVDALGHAVPQVRPRPELKAKVLAAATSRGQVVDFPAPGTATQPGVARYWYAPWLVAAAAAVLAVATSVGLVRARAEIDRLRGEIVAVESRLADADQRTVTATAEAREQRAALDVLASPDLVRTTLEGVPPTPNARALALLSPSQGTLLMSARGLPPAPPGRVYQLWAIVGSTPISAGTFVPGADGTSRVLAQVNLSALPAALAVTLEPEGGVPSPTGPKVMLGTPAN